MNATRSSSRRFVLLSAGLVIVLAGSLALRLVNRAPFFESRATEPPPSEPLHWAEGSPPAGEVSEPRKAAAEDLAFPRWAVPGYEPAIQFQTDLDLIAPLGNGPENAAVWFADFAQPSGARLEEYRSAEARAREAGLDRQRWLPDDPLLLEAEPWVDQATMRFYPDVWEARGWDRQIPNLLMALTLAKSWAARAEATDDLGLALADYRRAIRLGRLLRQEDVVLINDLVGLACIQVGLRGMYERLVEAEDAERALVVAVALGEHAPQRLKTAETFTRIDPARYLAKGWFGVDVRMSAEVFRTLTGMAEKHPDRRFRLEAILALNVARFEGTRRQRHETAELLDRLAASDDREIAGLADWAGRTPPDLERYEELFARE